MTVRLQYTSTFRGSIKLCNWTEPGQPAYEIMLDTRKSDVIEVPDAAAEHIVSLYPNAFVRVEGVSAQSPEEAPAETAAPDEEPRSPKRSR